MLLCTLYSDGTEPIGIEWLSQEHGNLWVLETGFYFYSIPGSWPLWYGFCIDWVEGELEGFSVVCQGISEGKCRKPMWRRALIFYLLSPWMLTLPGSRMSLEKKLLVVNVVRHHYHMLNRVIEISEYQRSDWAGNIIVTHLMITSDLSSLCCM